MSADDSERDEATPVDPPVSLGHKVEIEVFSPEIKKLMIAAYKELDTETLRLIEAGWTKTMLDLNRQYMQAEFRRTIAQDILNIR